LLSKEGHHECKPGLKIRSKDVLSDHARTQKNRRNKTTAYVKIKRVKIGPMGILNWASGKKIEFK